MTEIRSLRAYAEVALGRQRSPQHDDGPFMTPYLRAANVKDGELDLTDVKEMNFDPAEQQRFSLAPGDVLVTEGSGSLASVGASAVWSGELVGTVCFQNTLLRLRPRASTDGRFLAWWCRHAFVDGLFASISTGANIFHLSAERVRSLPMTYLAPERQRAIADFLDAETARIDGLIAKKRRMVGLLDEHFGRLIDSLTMGRRIQLRRVVRQFVDYRGATPEKSDSGVPLVTASHIKAGRVQQHVDPQFLTPDVYQAWMRRGFPSAGDVLMTTEAPLGEVAQLDDPGVGLAQRVILFKVESTRADPCYLSYALRSSSFRGELFANATGSTALGIKADRLKGLEVRLPSLDDQLDASLKLRCSERVSLEAKRALVEQVVLLQEHRQALITAAVTGELEVPGVVV